MIVSVGQIYIKPGICFPFSHRMQRWLGEQLSSLVDMSSEFRSKYGGEFSLMIRVSADTGTSDNVIKGPTVFKKDKEVEFTVFLPFDVIVGLPNGCCAAMELLVDGICSVFKEAGLDSSRLGKKKAFIVEHVCADPGMLKTQWQ